MKSAKIISLVFLTALVALLITACTGGLVPLVSYQGVLTDENGQPINDTVQFTYRLFNIGSGGSALYSQTENVAVTNGLFNSVVGPNTIVAELKPEDLTEPLYLEIQVANGVYTETLTPRQQLYGSPYAFTLMPGAVISSTMQGNIFSPNGVNGVLSVNNNYAGDTSDPALPALRVIGERGLELVSPTNDDGTIFSDQSRTSSDIFVYSKDNIQVYVDNDSNETGAFIVLASPGSCSIADGGDLSCSGTKSASVQIADEERLLYAVESPEVWFEDFGSGALVGGQATVTIEPLFAQSVNLGADYHVFITPLGDCSGLYVAEKTTTGFSVRELNGGISDIDFDYRIVAKRAGYEDVRMELSNLSTDAE